MAQKTRKQKKVATKKKKKPTIKQQKAMEEVVGNGGNVTAAMREAGYSEATINTPQKLTESKAWAEYMEEHLSDETLAQKHNELLNSSRLDHMTFPPLSKKKKNQSKNLTDEEIIEFLAEVNCTVRKIMHGELVRHVYFWSADNRARKDALDMAYKLKGNYVPEKSLNVDILFNEQQATRIAQRITGRDKTTNRAPSKKKSS